jgi:hypothetical protein
MHTLQTLQLLGLDPASPAARRAIGLVAENGRWEHAGQRYFDGEVEPCSARVPWPSPRVPTPGYSTYWILSGSRRACS